MENLKQAKNAYQKVGHVWAPMLNDDITFNSAGLRHLIRKRGVRRPQSEQIRRFALLKRAEDIIKNPDIVISSPSKKVDKLLYRHGKKKIVESRASFWKLKKKYDDQTVTVVVRQFEGGSKHFLSIY